MLLSANTIERVEAIVEPSDFYRESHGILFDCIRRMNTLGVAVDFVTVTAELDRQGLLAQVGGKVRVAELARLVPASSNVAHYAHIVREQAILRDLLAAASEMTRAVHDRDGQTGAELLGRFEERLEALRVRREREPDELVTLHQAAVYLDEKFRHPPDESDWIPGPWSFVSRMGPGRLYVLGGYAADGKTSSACQFFHRAVRAAHSSLFLTLEMSKEDLIERLAAVMGIPARLVQSARIPDDKQSLVRQVLGEMTQIAPSGTIWDAPAADIPTIRARVKAARPKLLIVDHLHQFHLRAEYERQDLEETIRGLWRIAREFKITVLLLAQLSRSGDKKHPFPMPTMSALKGSGAIEQLAWAVWFVYRLRDENSLPTDDGMFIVAKNRSGPTGTRRLTFHPHTTRYTEIAREEMVA